MKLDSRSENAAPHKRDHHHRAYLLTYLLAYLCVTERWISRRSWSDWIVQKRTRKPAAAADFAKNDDLNSKGREQDQENHEKP